MGRNRAVGAQIANAGAVLAPPEQAAPNQAVEPPATHVEAPRDTLHKNGEAAAIAVPAPVPVAATPPGPTDAAPVPAAATAPAPAALDVQSHDVLVHIEVICGGITNAKVPIAVVARYERLALAGAAKAFDRQLDSWLTRALDLGMVGSKLGQIFPINLQHAREEGRMNVDTLLLVGMGEPGRFAADDLRYLMSNVTVCVKSFGADHVSIPLIGIRRNELPIDRAVGGFLEGIYDGYQRFRAIGDAVVTRREQIRERANQPLFISLVEDDSEKADKILAALRVLEKEQPIPGMQIEVAQGEDLPLDPAPDPASDDVEPDVPVTLIRVTRNTDLPAKVANPAAAVSADTMVFQFSALTELAAITVREVELSSYFVRELPDRMINAPSPEDREGFCTFFANYFLPNDFRSLTHGPGNVTFVVDETSAALPWEMAAQTNYSKTSFLGSSLGVSRQFRTLQSPRPGAPPALNRLLKLLVIADPAPGRLSLPRAREEGRAVVNVLDHAQRDWKGEYEFEVTVRLGSNKNAGDVDDFINGFRELGDWVKSADACDPLELASLIVNEHFDVIHFAGHGGVDVKTGRAGWIFDSDCFLSAKEIFRVRQVPRLVFANACFSALVPDKSEHPEQLVGLAQAFFERGIPNYIGTGWEVDDEAAAECARWFYTRVLGLRNPALDDGVIGTSPPATIGEALRKAREAVFQFKKTSATWGAYQHYGRVADKLLPLPNISKRNGNR